MTVARRPLEERFWERVDKRSDSECWNWLGYIKPKGSYGLIGEGGRGCRRLSAHVVSYQLHHGPVPKGIDVCHSCDNKACVNPSHLFIGTRTENNIDAVRKNRSGAQKLTSVQAREVYNLKDSGMLQREVGEKYGLTQKAVSNIWNRRSWAFIHETCESDSCEI